MTWPTIVRVGTARDRRSDELGSPEALAAAGVPAPINDNTALRLAELLTPPGERTPRPGSGRRLWWTPAGVRAISAARQLEGVHTAARRAGALAAANAAPGAYVSVRWPVTAPDSVHALVFTDTDSPDILRPGLGWVAVTIRTGLPGQHPASQPTTPIEGALR